MSRLLQFALVLFFAEVSLSFANDDSPSPEFKSEPRLVQMISGGWRLRVVPEGSGVIYFGAGGSDYALIPKETFDFKGILEVVLPRLSEEIKKGSDVAVFVYSSTELSQTFNEAKYLDAKVAEPIFERALRKCESLQPERIMFFAKEQPVFKGIGNEIDPVMKTPGIMPNLSEHFKRQNPSPAKTGEE